MHAFWKHHASIKIEGIFDLGCDGVLDIVSCDVEGVADILGVVEEITEEAEIRFGLLLGSEAQAIANHLRPVLETSEEARSTLDIVGLRFSTKSLSQPITDHLEPRLEIAEEASLRVLGRPGVRGIDTSHEADVVLLERDHRVSLLESVDDFDVGRGTGSRDEGQVGGSAVVGSEAVVLEDTDLDALDEGVVDGAAASAIDEGPADLDGVVGHGGAVVGRGQVDGADGGVGGDVDGLDWCRLDDGKAEEGEEEQHRGDDVRSRDG